MPRYIDADEFLARMKRTPRYFDIKHDIEQMPTVDVVDANKSIPVDAAEALKKRAMIEVARRIFVKITGALRYTRFASPIEKTSTLNYICALGKEYVEDGSPGIYGGAECPICHGTGEIGTSDWLAKHISEKQLAKKKAEAVAEYDRHLKAEVAREIFEEIEKQLARYSHLHRYAEEAREVTEEYADGTPCEMTSVWEAISLHKNGWDDYETMCKLQDNIGNIEKSRLLKEFEGDIAELKKRYTEGTDGKQA